MSRTTSKGTGQPKNPRESENPRTESCKAAGRHYAVEVSAGAGEPENPTKRGHQPEDWRAPTRGLEGTSPRTGGNGEPENRDADQPALIGRGPEAVIACLTPSAHAHERSDTVKSTDLS